MQFGKYLLQKKKTIQQMVTKSLVGWKQSTDLKIADTTALLVDINQGGKHIRGALICLGYEIQTTKKSKDIFTVAAAYEILHTSLLIHDDIIDNSLLRRGMPTLFQKLGGDHYGISQAICLGDVGFFLATKMISETSFANEKKSQVISFFLQTVLDTITGQMLDVEVSQKNENVTEQDVITIARLKTAHYSLAGPLVIGAMLAGATKQQLKQFGDFGEQLGIAYQLRDDILGVFGDETTIGKSATSDITEGKQTLLLLYARESATQEQKKMLDRYYGKGKISVKEYQIIKQLFQETGALTKVENMIEQYTDEARVLVRKITKEKAMQQLLTDFISYLLERKK